MAKNILAVIGFALACLSTLMTIISFSTSHWLESYDEADSRFVKLGLWEACFNNFGYDRDNLGKVYHGCEWVFSYDYRPIFDWLVPSKSSVYLFFHLPVIWPRCENGNRTPSISSHLYLYEPSLSVSLFI